jgi:hypothetical protein
MTKYFRHASHNPPYFDVCWTFWYRHIMVLGIGYWVLIGDCLDWYIMWPYLSVLRILKIQRHPKHIACICNHEVVSIGHRLVLHFIRQVRRWHHPLKPPCVVHYMYCTINASPAWVYHSLHHRQLFTAFIQLRLLLSLYCWHYRLKYIHPVASLFQSIF